MKPNQRLHKQPQFPSLWNDQPPSRNLPVMSLNLLVSAIQTGSNAARGVVGATIEVLAPHNTHNTSPVAHHTSHLTRHKPELKGARNRTKARGKGNSQSPDRSISPKFPPMLLVASLTKSLASCVPAPVLQQFNAAVASAKRGRVSTAALPSRRIKGCCCLNPCSSLLHCLTPQKDLPKRQTTPRD